MSNVDLANKLLSIKKQIKETDEEIIRLNAKLESAMEPLEKMTLEQAQDKLSILEKKIKKLQTELEESEAELEEKYEV